MELTIAKAYKRELEKKISELFKEYEKNTTLSVSEIDLVRQGSFDKLGNEIDFAYSVEVKSHI